MIGEIIDELKDGFEGEVEDVIKFLRSNIQFVLETNAGPEAEGMLSMGVE